MLGVAVQHLRMALGRAFNLSQVAKVWPSRESQDVGKIWWNMRLNIKLLLHIRSVFWVLQHLWSSFVTVLLEHQASMQMVTTSQGNLLHGAESMTILHRKISSHIRFTPSSPTDVYYWILKDSHCKLGQVSITPIAGSSNHLSGARLTHAQVCRAISSKLSHRESLKGCGISTGIWEETCR